MKEQKKEDLEEDLRKLAVYQKELARVKSS